MKKEICLDMDGTFVDFYSVDGWLTDLMNCCTRPYEIAKPLVNMSQLAKHLNALKRKGYKIKIITWSSKAKNTDFDKLVENAKKAWLNRHLPSVVFDEINVLPYGTPKENYGDGYLFDDEEYNRNNWNGIAFDEKQLLENLKAIKRTI